MNKYNKRMEKIKTKKEEIYFNTDGYRFEVKNYEHKKTLESLITELFADLLPGNHKPDFKKDIMDHFFEILETIHSALNPLKISGIKLAELMELDIRTLRQRSKSYKDFKDLVKPKKDTFTVYATTDKELYRLDYAKRLIEVINELKEHRTVHWNVMIQAFNGVIRLNGISEYVVNPQFIKD